MFVHFLIILFLLVLCNNVLYMKYNIVRIVNHRSPLNGARPSQCPGTVITRKSIAHQDNG